MSRESIHQRIDELLGLLSIHNSRLSLHTEKLSQLDIDVLRKQCIDLYDEVNKLALQGKIKVTERNPIQTESSVPKQVEKERVPEVAKVESPVIEETHILEVIKEEPKETIQPKVEVKSAPTKPIPAHKADDEMLSLFEKFSSKPIETIAKGMSVAKRFEFQSVFFDGDHKAYNEFISALDNAENREAAFKIYHEYKVRLDWDNEDLKDELKALMYRKHTH